MALLPEGGWGPTLGRGHLDPRQAAEAVAQVRPAIAMPIHWGCWGGVAGAAAGRAEGFAIGLIGSCVLAVPVLTGSAAYGVSEAFRWRSGLDRKPTRAPQFYVVIVAATLVGMDRQDRARAPDRVPRLLHPPCRPGA